MTYRSMGTGAAVMALTVGGILATASAQAADGVTVVMADKTDWGTGPAFLPAGAQMAVLAGDPGQSGPFTFRLKFPAGYEIPAHTHSIDEVVTVISGSLRMGPGEKLDRAASATLPTGGLVAIPAEAPHFVWTEAETVVQVHGVGPLDIAYVDPATDPRESQVAN